ncbi:MAG: hypothetical protein ACOYB2_10600 [Limnohabitans sp.]
MAGIRQTYAISIKDDAGRAVASESAILVGDAEEEFNVTCPGSGNVLVPVSVDVSSLVALWIVSDKEVTMTLNDDGTPDAPSPITLAAGIPYWWYTGKGACPITIDLAGPNALKFVKADAGDAVVKGAFLTS